MTKLADNVTNYMSRHYGNRLAYAVWTNKAVKTATLYLYDGSEPDRQIDTGVNAIIEPLKNQYYSYWDDQPTYDIE